MCFGLFEQVEEPVAGLVNFREVHPQIVLQDILPILIEKVFGYPKEVFRYREIVRANGHASGPTAPLIRGALVGGLLSIGV